MKILLASRFWTPTTSSFHGILCSLRRSTAICGRSTRVMVKFGGLYKKVGNPSFFLLKSSTLKIARFEHIAITHNQSAICDFSKKPFQNLHYFSTLTGGKDEIHGNILMHKSGSWICIKSAPLQNRYCEPRIQSNKVSHSCRTPKTAVCTCWKTGHSRNCHSTFRN